MTASLDLAVLGFFLLMSLGIQFLAMKRGYYKVRMITLFMAITYGLATTVFLILNYTSVTFFAIPAFTMPIDEALIPWLFIGCLIPMLLFIQVVKSKR